MEEQKIAVLIDGDNISTKYAELIKDEADKYGDITVFRLYGSLNSPNLKQWYPVMPKYGITPVLQLSYANNKSIADQALTIDAMDMLYTRQIDIFFLCTSDSDFTKLAYRIKESGKTIIGMGEKKTPESLAQACNEFKVLELLLNAEKPENKAFAQISGVPQCDRVLSEKPQDSATDVGIDAPKISIPSEHEIVQKIYDSIDDDGENLSSIGNALRKSVPGFDVRYYKYKTFSALIKAHADIFEINEDKVHSVITIKRKEKAEVSQQGNALPVTNRESKKEIGKNSGKAVKSGKITKAAAKKNAKSKNKAQNTGVKKPVRRKKGKQENNENQNMNK